MADNWIGTTGNWSVAANWDSGVPTSSLDAVINTAAAQTITFDSGAGATDGAALTLTVAANDAFVVNGSSHKLTISGTATFNGTLTISSGNLSLGTASSVAGQFHQSGGI